MKTRFSVVSVTVSSQSTVFCRVCSSLNQLGYDITAIPGSHDFIVDSSDPSKIIAQLACEGIIVDVVEIQVTSKEQEPIK